MKRVSFVGHLAGIVAGFALHWNLLPLELVQPAILVPTLFLGYQWRARHLVPIRYQETEEDEECNRLFTDDAEQHYGRFDSRRHKRERDQNMHQILVHIRSALAVIVILSAFAFDVLGGMMLCSILSLVSFHVCVQSHALLLSGRSPDNEKRRLGTLWKGFILCCILTIVCDSMSVAGWIIVRVYWQSSVSIRLVPACAMLQCRLGVQLVALVLACRNLSDIGETGGGPFVVVFGYTILENAQIVGGALVTFITRRHWTAFEGTGIPLGYANVEMQTSQVV